MRLPCMEYPGWPEGACISVGRRLAQAEAGEF